MPIITGTNIDLLELEFDRDGRTVRNVTIPPGTKQVFIFSHGWNNDAAEARELYSNFFRNFEKIGESKFEVAALKPFAVVGVFWPSKRFNENLAVAAGGEAGGAAGVNGAGSDGEGALETKLDEMKSLFRSDEERRTLDAAKALLPQLNDRATARAAFVEKIRALLNPKDADGEDASKAFFDSEPDELMNALKMPLKTSAPPSSAGDDAATAAVGPAAAPVRVDEVVAASNFLSGFFNSAMNLLNYTTYYEMKTRAGTVGKNGLAPFLNGFPESIEAIHLIGHSFGGRVVTAAAANATTGKIKSLTLLQAAFSHNGFSKSKNGFFRAVVEQKKVKGPILITHSVLDKAVGVAYPLASRLNQDDRLALGDKNDRFGGMGRNGAQQMEAREVDATEMKLRPFEDAQRYAFGAPVIYNLNGDTLITGHGDVTNEAIVFATLSAVAKRKS